MTEIATQQVARARAAQIRAGIQNYLHTLSHIAAAYAQRDWKALGYDSWDRYVDGEYSEHRLKLSPEHRQKAVAELRLAGMSQRAIGTALGVDQATVLRDLRRGDADASPDEIQGADGKTYASTRTTAARAQFGAPADGADDGNAPSPPAGTGAHAVHAAPARPGPVEGSPGPGRVTPTTAGGFDLGLSDVSDTEPAWTPGADAAPGSDGQKTSEPGVIPHDPDEFAAALDRLVPDSNPHREWQRRFLDAISGVHKVMRFTPADVAERADEVCIEELIRVADAFADYRLRTVNARIANLPDNVTPIRRAQ